MYNQKRALFDVVNSAPLYTKTESINSKTGEISAFSLDNLADSDLQFRTLTFDDVEAVDYNPITQTEQAGYKPPRLQVMEFLVAGERLIASQKQMYYQSQDLLPEEDKLDLPLPKIRKQGYDLVDAWKDLRDYNLKLDEYKEAVQARQLLDKQAQDKLFSEFQAYREEIYQKQGNITQEVKSARTGQSDDK